MKEHNHVTFVEDEKSTINLPCMLRSKFKHSFADMLYKVS